MFPTQKDHCPPLHFGNLPAVTWWESAGHNQVTHYSSFPLPAPAPGSNSNCFLNTPLDFSQRCLRLSDVQNWIFSHFSSIQSLSRVQLFMTPWTAARQASLSITNSQSLLNSCPLSQWCHPAISSSVVPFSSRLELPLDLAYFRSFLPLKWRFSLTCYTVTHIRNARVITLIYLESIYAFVIKEQGKKKKQSSCHNKHVREVLF